MQLAVKLVPRHFAKQILIPSVYRISYGFAYKEQDFIKGPFWQCLNNSS